MTKNQGYKKGGANFWDLESTPFSTDEKSRPQADFDYFKLVILMCCKSKTVANTIIEELETEFMKKTTKNNAFQTKINDVCNHLKNLESFQSLLKIEKETDFQKIIQIIMNQDD